jgi:hypothetical protein
MSGEEEIVRQIVRRHSNLLGHWIWETYRRGGTSCVNQGVKRRWSPLTMAVLSRAVEASFCVRETIEGAF